MPKEKERKNSVIKIILTDTAGVVCLILVPLLGPLPGPGGIPLLIAGLGLLAANHDWADRWLHYAKVHSESLRHIFFPNITWVKWSWDIFVVFLIVAGTWLNIVAEPLWLRAFSYVVLAGSTTIFMFNRDRIIWLDKKVRPNSGRHK